MSTFTILNHGTNFHREKTGELISDFGRNMAGTEADFVTSDNTATGDFLICEGPGSAPKNVMRPGTYNPFTGEKKGSFYTLKHMFKSDFYNSFYGSTPYRTKLTGAIAGGGWTDNVAKASLIVFNLATPPDTINLIGWSRGAVTCLRMANMFKGLIPDSIKINIFAVDPVAGGDAGLKKEDTQIIPDTVRNYVAILSMHEKRTTFNPQDLSRIQIKNPQNTKVCFLPFPGTHSMQVQAQKLGKLDSPRKVTYYLAYKFLKKFDTRFKQGYNPANYGQGAICDMYAQMRMDMSDFREHSTSGLSNRLMSKGVFHRREFSKSQMGQYVKISYFINEHHRSVFKRTFPLVYQYLFSSKGDQLAITNQMFGYKAPNPTTKLQFENLAQTAPETLKSLGPFGVFWAWAGFKQFLHVGGPGRGRENIHFNAQGFSNKWPDSYAF